ncbi:MAG TPA: helix-turn-helix transcriptional regulator [Candidatus Dormibacteraeota bacterium]|nr:helix-turn-helix transcriptional regulator [Candidatus Dormibacteraeota bacterium]
MTPGAVLAAKRGERGLSIEQVAASTRIRAEHLRALEADDFERFPAPVYAKGFLRTYATYLGLDSEELLDLMPTGPQSPSLALGLDKHERRPRAVLTTPVVAAAGLVLLAGMFAGYAWRQVAADQRAATAIVSPPAATSVAATAVASPAIQARPIVVGVRVTDVVWINVVVDGTPQYGDSGRTLPAGSIVYFTGVDVKITSGKGSATFITIDGRNLGPLGVGVATREFSSQTSP